MNAEYVVQLGLIALTAGLILMAVRSTYRLWRLYRQDHGRSLLLLAFLVVACIATVLGPWIGFLLLRRFLGYPPLEWSSPITSVLVILVLLIPSILDYLVRRVGRDPAKPDNIGNGPA